MSQVKKIPMRKCVGCQEMKSKKEMIRVLKTSENEIILDATGKKNGRGAYICPSSSCLKKAKKRLALNLETEIPDEIFDTLALEMEKIKGND